MWIPLRSAKMYGRILGFQRRVWWPKWTPASSSWRMETDGMGEGPPVSVVPPRVLGSVGTGRHACWRPRHLRGERHACEMERQQVHLIPTETQVAREDAPTQAGQVSRRHLLRGCAASLALSSGLPSHDLSTLAGSAYQPLIGRLLRRAILASRGHDERPSGAASNGLSTTSRLIGARGSARRSTAGAARRPARAGW
jgi:hypothetical protein